MNKEKLYTNKLYKSAGLPILDEHVSHGIGLMLRNIIDSVPSGAGIGAGMGLLTGLGRIGLSKEARKHAIKTMLLHILGGGTIGAVSSGAKSAIRGYRIGADRIKKLQKASQQKSIFGGPSMRAGIAQMALDGLKQLTLRDYILPDEESRQALEEMSNVSPSM